MTKIENKKSGTKLSIKPIGIGVTVGVIIITLILFLGAALISSEKVPESFGSTIICIAAFLGPAFGGLIAARKNKAAFVLSGIVVGFALFFLRMIVSAFAANGELFGLNTLKLMIFMLLGGFFGGLMAGKKRHKRKK